jgi:hypothetical protein
MQHAVSVPSLIDRYQLFDEDECLPNRFLFETDATFETVPDDCDDHIRTALEHAIELGAEVAWFGFEGSFHFEHILTDDIANQIYGVADQTGISVAVADNKRQSEDWKQRIQLARSFIQDERC